MLENQVIEGTLIARAYYIITQHSYSPKEVDVIFDCGKETISIVSKRTGKVLTEKSMKRKK